MVFKKLFQRRRSKKAAKEDKTKELSVVTKGPEEVKAVDPSPSPESPKAETSKPVEDPVKLDAVAEDANTEEGSQANEKEADLPKSVSHADASEKEQGEPVVEETPEASAPEGETSDETKEVEQPAAKANEWNCCGVMVSMP